MTPNTQRTQAAPAPATLGDVLYAKQPKTLVLEEEWVALVRSVSAGDQLALHALYQRSHRVVFTLAMRITKSRETAEEVTLDVFYDVWRRAFTYDPGNGTVLGWIMNQARSRSIDRLRFEQRKKRADRNDDGVQTTDIPDERDQVEAKQESAMLRNALAALTPDERQAIESAFFGELNYAEVASRLAQPLGTVKTPIRSALHKLRHILAGEARS